MKHSPIIFTAIVFYCLNTFPMERKGSFTESECEQQKEVFLERLREAQRQREQDNKTSSLKKQDSSEAFKARLQEAHKVWLQQNASGEEYKKGPVNSDDFREMQDLNK